MDRPKLCTKNFLIVSTANFFLYFIYYLLMVTITIFVVDKFQDSPSEAGLASGIFVIGILIARLFSGRYIDQIGWKKTLYMGFILFLITTCFYIFVDNLEFLLINRLLNGAAIIALSYSSILTFIASYTKEIDLIDAGSYFFIVYAIFVLVSRPFTGRLFDKKGENIVMYPAILLLSLCLFFVSITHNGFTLLLAGALLGLSYGTTSSSVQAISVKVSPKDRIGLAISTNYIFQDIGIGFGPFVLGFLVPIIGYRGLYTMMGFVAFICLFLYYFLHGRKAV